jgi:hypothetical protein
MSSLYNPSKNGTGYCDTPCLIALLGRHILVCPLLGSENTAIQRPIPVWLLQLLSNDQSFWTSYCFLDRCILLSCQIPTYNISTNERRCQKTINLLYYCTCVSFCSSYSSSFSLYLLALNYRSKNNLWVAIFDPVPRGVICGCIGSPYFGWTDGQNTATQYSD